MGKVKDEELFTLIKNYFTIYLPAHRSSSPYTIKNYRKTLTQYLEFIAAKNNTKIMSVTFPMLTRSVTDEFISYLVDVKKVAPATRNNKLAAIKGFLQYASGCRAEYMELYSEISKIKSTHVDVFAKVDYLTEDAIKALFDAPDTSTEIGLRDQCLMIFMYDTGARIHEITGVNLCDIRFDSTDTVTLHGKGKKTRIVPLMKDTVVHLKNYLAVFHEGENLRATVPLFYAVYKKNKIRMNDDTIRKRLRVYVPIAREKCSSVPEHIHPHLFRHSRAMHLYQHGMDLSLVSQWLGHEQLRTTLTYAYADTNHKRTAIEKAMGTAFDKDGTIKPYTIEDEETLKHLYGL